MNEALALFKTNLMKTIDITAINKMYLGSEKPLNIEIPALSDLLVNELFKEINKYGFFTLGNTCFYKKRTKSITLSVFKHNV